MTHFMHRPTTLYRMYDEQDRMIYVGITCNVTNRMRAHQAEKPWWADVCRIEMERYPNQPAARAVEAKIIQTVAPVHNGGGGVYRTRQTIRNVDDSEPSPVTTDPSLGHIGSVTVTRPGWDDRYGYRTPGAFEGDPRRRTRVTVGRSAPRR